MNGSAKCCEESEGDIFLWRNSTLASPSMVRSDQYQLLNATPGASGSFNGLAQGHFSRGDNGYHRRVGQIFLSLLHRARSENDVTPF